MKFKLFSVFVLASISFLAEAQTVSKLLNQIQIDPPSRSAIVLFKAESDSDYWLEKVKRLMRTQDDMAIMNPYWIVGFSDESIVSTNRCGIVIGRWYTSGYPHKDRWEAILENGLSKIRYTVIYVSDEGGLVSPDRAQANKLLQQCG